MSWAKFDDGFPDHLKVRTIDDAAFRLHVTAVCFACKYGTNGRINAAIPATLTRAPQGTKLVEAIGQLEDEGLWDPVDGGWLVHDFLDWNPTAEKANAKHEARQAAGKLGGKRSAEIRAKLKQKRKQLLADEPSNPQPISEAESNPVPVPVPVAATAAAERPQQPCPTDLWDRMPEPSKATLETAMIPRWAQEQICHGFAAKYSGRPSETRSMDAWVSSVITAIQGIWNDPNKRPRLPIERAEERTGEHVATYADVLAKRKGAA